MSDQASSAGGAGPAVQQAPPPRKLCREPPAPPLRVDVRRHGGCVVVRLCGVAGMVEADGLRERLEALAEQAAPVIILDLADLAFIGSAGLTAIVCAYVKSRRRRGEIRLAAPQPSVLGVLERTRLTELFDIYDSVAGAVMGSAS